MGDSLVGMTFSFAPAPPSRDDGQAPRGGLGSQVLPVAELGDDFAGDPEDGSQYLFLVRREAATHAKVLRVDNPYAARETAPVSTPAVPSSRPSDPWREAFVRNFEAARQRMLTAPIHSMPPVDPGIFPPPRDEGAWRVFVNGKRSKPAKPAPVNPSSSKAAPPTSIVEPSAASQGEDVEMSDDLEAAKAAILASLDLDAPEPAPARPVAAPAPAPAPSALAPAPAAPPQVPEYERLPQLPSPALLVAIPRPTLVHLLSHFHDWFVERIDAYEDKINYVPSTIFAPPALRRRPAAGAAKARAAVLPPPPPPKPSAKLPPTVAPRPPLPTAHESHWILSALTRLEQLLDGEDLSSLRLLAKTLASMAEVSEAAREKRAKAAAGVKAGGRSMQERLEDEGRARCWMIVAAIAGVWAQADLWDATL